MTTRDNSTVSANGEKTRTPSTYNSRIVSAAGMQCMRAFLRKDEESCSASLVRRPPQTAADDAEWGVEEAAEEEEAALNDTGTPPPQQQPVVTVTVRLHAEAQLACEVAGGGGSSEPRARPWFEATWRHAGEPVDAVQVSNSALGAQGHRLSRDPVTGQLNIASARLEDDGLWQCEERDPVTARMVAVGAPVRLVVLEPPRAPYLSVDSRRLDAGNAFLPVREGAELVLWCTVEGGHPSPRLAWLLNADPLNGTRLDSPAHHHWRAETRLGPVLRDHHNATVTCTVRHVTLSAPLNVSLLLDVQYTPSFMISRVPGFGFPITEGMAVSLKCEVDSNPPSSPVWLKDDRSPPVAQSADGSLNFSAILREHSGWYKCTCRHPQGDFSSIGYFLNVRFEDDSEVTQDPGTGEAGEVQVALGGALQLQCPSGGISCWGRAGPSGLEPLGAGPRLVLDRLVYQEAGEYRCVEGRRPDLDEWRVPLSVKVDVTGAPEVVTANRTLTALTGQQLALTMSYCANPAASHLVWLTPRRKALRPGDVDGSLEAHYIAIGRTPYCHKAMLMLHSVTLADEGEYVFLVRSPRGLAEGSVTLNVTHASSFSVPAAGARHLAAALPVLAAILTLPQFYVTQTFRV